MSGLGISVPDKDEERRLYTFCLEQEKLYCVYVGANIIAYMLHQRSDQGNHYQPLLEECVKDIEFRHLPVDDSNGLLNIIKNIDDIVIKVADAMCTVVFGEKILNEQALGAKHTYSSSHVVYTKMLHHALCVGSPLAVLLKEMAAKDFGITDQQRTFMLPTPSNMLGPNVYCMPQTVTMSYWLFNSNTNETKMQSLDLSIMEACLLVGLRIFSKAQDPTAPTTAPGCKAGKYLDELANNIALEQEAKLGNVLVWLGSMWDAVIPNWRMFLMKNPQFPFVQENQFSLVRERVQKLQNPLSANKLDWEIFPPLNEPLA